MINFMKTIKCLLIAYLLFIPNLAVSAIVTWKASGTITSVSQLDTISVGDNFDLYYTFDTFATDSNSSETRGRYQLQTVTLDMPSFFATTSINSAITIDNSDFDRYTLNTSTPSGFYSHNSQLIGDRELISIVTQYTDDQATLFSNDTLPNTPFDLALVETAQLELLLSNDWQSGVAFDAQWIYGEITSITAVPVPSAVWLFGSGLIGLVGLVRRKR